MRWRPLINGLPTRRSCCSSSECRSLSSWCPRDRATTDAVESIRFEADDLRAAMHRLEVSLARCRRWMLALAWVHTAASWIGLVGAMMLVGLLLRASPIPAWALLAVFGLALLTRVVRMLVRPLSRHVRELEGQRLSLMAPCSRSATKGDPASAPFARTSARSPR
jgi:hypothetical protein